MTLPDLQNVVTEICAEIRAWTDRGAVATYMPFSIQSISSSRSQSRSAALATNYGRAWGANRRVRRSTPSSNSNANKGFRAILSLLLLQSEGVPGPGASFFVPTRAGKPASAPLDRRQESRSDEASKRGRERQIQG